MFSLARGVGRLGRFGRFRHVAPLRLQCPSASCQGLQSFATISRPQELHRHRKRLEGFGKDAPPGDEKTLGDCRNLLKDDDWFARKVAVDAIAKVSQKGDEVQLALLYKHLEDDDIFVREAAVDAVVQVAQPQDEVAVTKVSMRLSDEGRGGSWSSRLQRRCARHGALDRHV
ncbi:unnamed protein product [Effrenium voratum]|uniref:Uncharacterized protein n=1 Tax=Effrenium voratum TaxID=2562239 RepID=A0AA36IYY1_9DINO|nr:unnamed protein product [Effrenium voratum]